MKMIFSLSRHPLKLKEEIYKPLVRCYLTLKLMLRRQCQNYENLIYKGPSFKDDIPWKATSNTKPKSSCLNDKPSRNKASCFGSREEIFSSSDSWFMFRLLVLITLNITVHTKKIRPYIFGLYQ